MTKKSLTLEVDPSIMEQNMRIVKETPMEEEFNKILASVDTVPSKLVTPIPGFCVKTCTKYPSKKVFVNICLTEAIPCPRNVSNEELMQILSSEDPSSYRVPMSIGEGRTEQDNSGAPATAYDVAINSDFFRKIKKDDLFRTFFLTVVFEGLQDKYQFELDFNKCTILKNRKAFGNLQTHRIQIRDIESCENNLKSPLIEEIVDRPSKHFDKIKKDILYRLRREPPTGEIEYLLAEFKIPPSHMPAVACQNKTKHGIVILALIIRVQLQDLNLAIGEDRLVLDFKRMYNQVDFFLPCSVDSDIIDAQLNRNSDMLYVKMPVIN